MKRIITYMTAIAAATAAADAAAWQDMSSAVREKTSAEDEVFVPCSRKCRTSFAIIADIETYRECKAEIEAYREVLEDEGLGTYIMAGDWDDPMELRKQIISLSEKKPVLEGIVLVGDIPIAMIREGQHLTTAFKMDEERFPEFESSVASDRFYDDFDLDFELLGQDTTRSDVFYYRLSEKGAQTLRPEIYSARMKVPGVMQGDRYGILRDYLKKVVRAHIEQNVLDNMSYFAGHGYNSDCLTVWRQKPLVFRENFPYCFDRSSHNSKNALIARIPNNIAARIRSRSQSNFCGKPLSEHVAQCYFAFGCRNIQIVIAPDSDSDFLRKLFARIIASHVYSIIARRRAFYHAIRYGKPVATHCVTKVNVKFYAFICQFWFERVFRTYWYTQRIDYLQYGIRFVALDRYGSCGVCAV